MIGKTYIKTNLVVILIGATYIILGVKFFRFIWRFTSKLLFWDHWDIFDQVLFSNNFFQLFFYQHNEHRIGIGLVLTKILANISRWNPAYETILTGLIIFTASVLALQLKRKLTAKYEVYDLIIPFLFLNLYQYDNLIWGFQIAYVLPLFWLTAAAYIFTLKNSMFKNLSLIGITILSSYSSLHGLFVALIISLYFLIQFFNESKDKRIYIYLFGVSIIIVATYFINYQKVRFLGAEDFSFRDLITYISYQINGFVGYYSKKVFILLTPIAAFISFVHLLIRILKEKGWLDNYVILSFYIFSFSFLLATAYGRIGTGVESAYTSRYVTLITPLFFGMYLYLLKVLPKSYKDRSLAFLLVFFVFVASQNNHFNFTYSLNRKTSLDEWGQCYFTHQDIKYCDRTSKAVIYHSPDKINLKSKLDYLIKNRLNYFTYLR